MARFGAPSIAEKDVGDDEKRRKDRQAGGPKQRPLTSPLEAFLEEEEEVGQLHGTACLFYSDD